MPTQLTEEPDFATFAGASTRRLRSSAFLMCRDWHLAQDLTQVTLTKLYLVWGRASTSDSVEAYAQKTLLRTFLDHRRRRSYAEQSWATAPDAMPQDRTHRESSDLRLTMLHALDQLSPRDRAILILRFWEDLSVERVAEVLDIPVSMVKTQTRRSLAKMRQLLDADQLALFA
jgi:RNA polymerase sigma factor (sigma-70 family)